MSRGLFRGNSGEHGGNDESEPIDRDKLEGAWLSEEEVVFIRFADSGVARLAGLDWKDDQFQMVQGEMII
jgi:hypothetical protein